MADHGVLPAFILGVGEMGARVLADLAEQIGHAYGPEVVRAVSLLSVGIGNDPPAAGIPYYNLYEDATDWLARPDRSGVPELLQGWLAPAGRGREHLTPERLLELNNRQLVRLMFLKHLDRAYSRLNEFLRQDTGRLRKSSGTSIYLLASLDEVVGSALLLDLATVLRGALRNVAEGRDMIAYLALPGARPARDNDGDQSRTEANAFAALRELEQSDLTTHIPPAAVLPLSYAPGSQCPITYVCLYGDQPADTGAQVDQQLVAQWSNALLAQIDQKFGASFIEKKRINLSAVKGASGVEDELLVSTQSTAAAVFPRAAVQNLWGARLAREALDLHLRVGLSAQEWQTEIEWWSKQAALSDESDHQVYSPRVVRHLLTLDTTSRMRAHHLTNMSLVMLVQRWICGLDDTYASRLHDVVRRASAALNWEPNANAALNLEGAGGARRFREQIERDLIRLFGSLAAVVSDTDTDEVTRGEYYGILQDVAARQSLRFHTSLLTLVRHLLAKVGGAHTLAALQYLADKLAQAYDTLEEARHQPSPIQMWWDQLRRASTLTELTERRLRPRPSSQVRQYVALAKDIVEMRKRQIALRILAQMTAAWINTVHDLIPRLDAVQQVVSGDGALYHRMAQRETELSGLITRDDGRYWLFDDEWADRYYTRWIQPHAGELAEQLAWSVLYPERSFESLATVQFELRLTHLPLPVSTHEYNHDANADRFWREAERSVRAAEGDLNLWSYLLGGVARHTRAIGDRLAQVDSLLTGVYSDSGISYQRSLLEPDKSQAQPEQGTALLEQIKTGALANFDPEDTGSRAYIMTFADTQLIPMRQTRGYLQARDAYLGLPERVRSQMFVFPREATAAALEAAMKFAGLLAEADQLSPPTVALLVHRERLDGLAWMEALEWLGRVGYSDGARSSYALELPPTPDHPADKVWLGSPGRTLRYYLAVHDFCLSDDWQRDQEYGGGRVTLDDLMLPARVDAHIAAKVNDWIASGRDFPAVDYWDWAVSIYQREMQPWALQQAYRAGLMHTLYERCLAHSRDTASQERELNLLLAHSAHTIFADHRMAIRERMNY
ncbi:MAG: hypothetical protein JXQ72_08035 [Anaerolineae bacterium]|nr:hypothetical protein [Anaerolineae bacterium]